MSVSHERPSSQEPHLSGVAELLLQEPVRKHLKAALGIIAWEKQILYREGTTLKQVGTFISTTSNLYDICRIEGGQDFAVWRYGLEKLNDAGRPIAPRMEQYKTLPGARDGIIRISPADQAELPKAQDPEVSIDDEGCKVISFSIDLRGPDITLDLFNPEVIHVENSTVPALRADVMLEQFGVAVPRP